MEKISKAIEEHKLTVKIKILLWEFNLYWKFMCPDENNDKKIRTPPPASSTPVTVFLNCRKNTKPKPIFCFSESS